MTNEQKARELAKLKNPQLAVFPNLSAVYEYGLECAMKMAAWKEQQMYEKALRWLEKHVEEYASFDETKADWGNKLEFLEDFKHAMLSKQ